jgi:hypothetical protein
MATSWWARGFVRYVDEHAGGMTLSLDPELAAHAVASANDAVVTFEFVPAQDG